MEMVNSRRITNIGVMTLLYVVLMMVCSPLAYKDIQFRFSEMLMLFCCFNKDYIFSVTLGCCIVNIWSPLGFVDIGFGTAATLLAALLMYLLRGKVNLLVASFLLVLTNSLIIALELKIMQGLPYWKSAGTVAIGEFICVSIIGVSVVRSLTKNSNFMKLIMTGTNYTTSKEA